MAQVEISALTAADPLTGIEEAPFVQGGATKKATAEQIRAYVASQPNVFTVTQRIEDAAPALQFSENDTVDQNWEFIGVAGALRLDELNDAFSTIGTHHTFTHGGGTQFGAPTGGDQGAGTVNATGLYVNGDPVLQDSDLAANGGLVPTLDRKNTFTSVQRLSGTFSGIELEETDTVDKNWFLVTDGGNFQFQERDDAFSVIRSHSRFFHGGGMIVGSPTGSDQGAGTINAEAVYDDGTLLTDYVFDAEIDGAVDADAYDAATPDREYKDDEGRVLKTETRNHVPARKFSSSIDELDPASFEQKWRATRKLPAVARLERDKPSIGELSQALLETCEVQAVHIAKLEARIAALEAEK